MMMSKLNTLLSRKLGEGWHELEIETISLELGALFDKLSVLKLIMLKTLMAHPENVLTDADYFLRFVEVANQEIPDPHHHDIPTSLELAWALSELVKILGSDKVRKNNMLSNVIRYVINNEGHGETYHRVLSVYSGEELITNEKTKACDEYLDHMMGE